MADRCNLTINYVLTGSDGSKMADGHNTWVDVPYEGAVAIEGLLVELLGKTVDMGKTQVASKK